MKAKTVLYGLAIFVLLSGTLTLSFSTARADDPTATPQPTITPTTYYNFVIPGLEIPIILPTSFQLPAKTPIYVNYTPAPNLNPHGLQTDQFALHMIAEAINLSQATLDVMGAVGWILDFLIWVWLGGGTILLISNIAKRGGIMVNNFMVGGPENDGYIVSGRKGWTKRVNAYNEAKRLNRLAKSPAAPRKRKSKGS